MWEVGWGGSELSPGLTPASMGSGVMGERHACRPRMAGQSAEIEFPRLLREPGDESPGKNGIKQNGRTEMWI